MTKKTDVKIYVNILPLIIIFLLIGGAGYFLFGQDMKLPSIGGDSIKVSRIEGLPKRVTVEEEKDKTRKIITSEEELTQFMAEIDPEGQIDLRENFNFDKNYLLAVASSSVEGPLNKYKIKKVESDSEDKKLTVEHELTVPMEDECPEKATEEEMAVKSIIVDMVLINKTDWEIDFTSLKRELPCGEF